MEAPSAQHDGQNHSHFNWTSYIKDTEAGEVVDIVVLQTCLTILGVCLGTRFKYHFMPLNLVRALSLSVYWANTCFIWAIDLTMTLTEERGAGACLSTLDVCLAFYVWTKIATYIVFIAHARPLTTQSFVQDYKFLSATGLVVLGYGLFSGYVFSHPKMAYVILNTRHCKIGVPDSVSIGLLSFDIMVSIVICFTAFWHLHHRLRGSPLYSQRLVGWPSLRACRAAIPFSKPDERYYTPSAQPEYHAAKTLMASLFLLLGTIGNLVAMIVFHGHAMPWLCIATCTANSTAACMAVHYVTSKGPYAKILKQLDNERHALTHVQLDYSRDENVQSRGENRPS